MVEKMGIELYIIWCLFLICKKFANTHEGVIIRNVYK